MHPAHVVKESSTNLICSPLISLSPFLAGYSHICLVQLHVFQLSLLREIFQAGKFFRESLEGWHQGNKGVICYEVHKIHENGETGSFEIVV